MADLPTAAGSITSDTTVNTGGTLRGTGTITPQTTTGNVTVNAGSTLWPGATGETSGHTLTVAGANGNVTFAGTALAPAYFVSTGFVSSTGVATNDVLTLTGTLTPTEHSSQPGRGLSTGHTRVPRLSTTAPRE